MKFVKFALLFTLISLSFIGDLPAENKWRWSVPTEVNPVTDYFTEVALGSISGHSILGGIGERESIGTTATGEDIWR